VSGGSSGSSPALHSRQLEAFRDEAEHRPKDRPNVEEHAPFGHTLRERLSGYRLHALKVD
jgi:hypothetical protein